MFKAILYTVLLALSLHVHAQITPFRPAAVPLAVRTPYLNSWLLGGRQGPALGDDWSKLSNEAITGWGGFVRVDGITYRVMGSFALDNGRQKSTQLGITITPTQSNFVLQTGPVNTYLNFLSPIEIEDYVRMSLPFSYLAVEIKSNDGKVHDVQVYFDMSGEFISGIPDREVMDWNTTVKSDLVYHNFGLQTPQQYIETNQRIEYGRAFHATTLAQGVTYATCSDVACRDMFTTDGKLDGTQDLTPRIVSRDWPVMALSYALGSITETQQPLVFVLGHARDPVVQYQSSANVAEERSLFFHTSFDNIEDALSFFVKDYPKALETANAFDKKLQSAAAAYTSDYYPVLALAARQVLARVEITVGKNADGSPNRDDILIFMHGDRTSAIEELYASTPFWLYLNPELLRLLLQPILNEHIKKGISPSQGTVMDLGTSYPRITGHQTSDTMPIEATGDLLIMTAAYVRASGNASIILNNYQLFNGFAQFLNSSTLSPSAQLSADGLYLGQLTGDTNLAIKGIIALKAYGDLVTQLGKSEGTGYTSASIAFAQAWEQQALAGDTEYRLTYTSDDASWSMEYNVFVDKWLNTGLLSSDVFTRLSSTYQQRLAPFGVPIDSRNTYTKPEWMMFAAGLVPDASTRDKLITSVSNFLSSGQGNKPWSDLYDSSSGNITTFVNRAVVGGVYSLLAKDIPVKPLGAISDQSTTNSAMLHSVSISLLLSLTYLGVFHLV